eukprot:TRINITY_DN103006_c0_g1_i1.p1 TRINITY_DN103006_c0_g1~~TRINITY_DN103006_c0_g1_i1.p1  ORF type:complete len:265 (-),score=37.31 TRINITY_DN103006_c0_g1_i1:340-1134(-)
MIAMAGSAPSRHSLLSLLCWLFWWSMPSIVSYNVLSATQQDRFDDIFRVFRKSLCVCLQGTRLAQRDGEAYRYELRAGFHHISFPFKKGSNGHAGLSIAINADMVEKEQIVQIVAPQDRLLQGRIAGARVKYRNADIFFLNCYMPPGGLSGKNKDDYIKVVNFLGHTMDRVPGRSLPVVCMDANARVGHPTLYTGERSDEKTDAIGPHRHECEDAAGRTLRELMQIHMMADAGTFFEAGHTYWSGSHRGTTSRTHSERPCCFPS